MRDATYLSTVQVHCQREHIPHLRNLLFLSPDEEEPEDSTEGFNPYLASKYAGRLRPIPSNSDPSWRLHHWGCGSVVLRSLAITGTEVEVPDSITASLVLETTGGFPDAWVADMSASLSDALIELTFRSVEDACAGFWEFKDGAFLAGYMDDSWDGSDFDGRGILQTNRETDEFARKLVEECRILNSK